MEIEEKPKGENKAGRIGCIVAIIVIVLLIIAFFSGIFDFRELGN